MSERTRQASARADHDESNTRFARDGAAWSECTSLGADAYRIRLGGLLRSAWMVGVCNGLGQARVSIQRAHARRLLHDGTWIAELHVIALPGANDPLQLPLIDFAAKDDIATSRPLHLRSYTLVESSDHGGTLRLNFVAQDHVGLLGSLLAAFASLSLLPLEMHIETQHDEARDCLWLAASGPTKPRDSDRRALDALLKRAVQN